MCTALRYKSYMGRNFDYEVSYNEEIVTIPAGEYDNSYAIIGICTGAVQDYPLLYDGINEFGLTCAGLAFEGNAYYRDIMEVSDDFYVIPAYDFVFQILSNFVSVGDVKEYLKKVQLVDEPFSDGLPNSDLHWFISDAESSIVVEQTEDGLKVYDSDVGVLTNNPPYPMQIEILDRDMMSIGNFPDAPSVYASRGTETFGLLGDYTSYSRFVRAFYLKHNLEQAQNSFNDLAQAFHLLESVAQIYGSTPVENRFEYTIYSVVYDMSNFAMTIRTYDDINTYHIEFGFNECKRVRI